MNTILNTLPSIYPIKALAKSDAFKYVHATDPRELLSWVREGVIRVNEAMSEDTSLRVLPGAPDCVDVYTVKDLCANYCSGVGVVLNADHVDSFLPHHGPKDFQPLVREYHRGDIDLASTLVGFYYIKGDNSDLQIWHPELFHSDFIEYMKLRAEILPESNVSFSEYDDMQSINRALVLDTFRELEVNSLIEFLNLVSLEYSSTN